MGMLLRYHYPKVEVKEELPKAVPVEQPKEVKEEVKTVPKKKK